ncbi:ABC transporter substrate-binding protein [Thiobaca trueperi]|uniref:Iron complex transport system substrate-binding protein n=1 Tax=Thiobaca trueperi TaxID=127458 RepID=A0A4R3N712_9GAMM|nr:ABC transporter substrate-binding protein [Thiobaca trueperi]TCT24287.1 iron complex transport system substrate-binding protein [Thiobaca trueperi]
MKMRSPILKSLILIGAWLVANPVLAERQIVDMAGRMVALPDRIHKVYAVGHCIPIVGAMAPDLLANSYRLPEAARPLLAPVFFEGKTTPNSGIRFSDEEVIRMAPDLVVMEAIPGAAERAERMQKRIGAPVVLVDQDMLHYKEAFAVLGEILDRREQARAMTDFVVRHLDPIREVAQTIPEDQRVRVYYAEGPDGLSTNPAGSSHTQVLDFVGAANVAQVKNLPDEGLSAVSLEQIYLWQPELILVWTPAADRLTTWRAIVEDPLWQKIAAVRNGQVVQIPWLPFSWLDRPPGTNRILGALWLAELFYPDRYDIDLAAATKEYFAIFYHREIADENVRKLLRLTRPDEAASTL